MRTAPSSKLPQQSAATVTLLNQRDDGVWEFTGTEIADHIDVFLKVDGHVDSSQWALAAIAASIQTKYGKSEIEEFAIKVKRTPRHIRRIARTYRETAEKGRYRPNLTFSHHVEAISHADVDEALDHAEAEDLSALGLRDWVNQKARARLSEAEKTAERETFRQFLERAEAVIMDDWLVTCPDTRWANRMFKPVLDEIRWKNRELYMETAKERVESAIQAGAFTVLDIKAATDLPMKEVEQIISGMVREGVYEFVDKGGETEVARGTRQQLLHRVGTPVFV